MNFIKLLIVSFLLFACGAKKESCTDVLTKIEKIEENSNIQREKILTLKKNLATEKNEEWKKTIKKTLKLTQSKIDKNTEKVREINRKNQRCYSS